MESFDVDKFLREHDQPKPRAIDPAFAPKAQSWHDPFADDTDVLPTAKQPKKPVSPAASKPPAAPKPESPKPALIEEL